MVGYIQKKERLRSFNTEETPRHQENTFPDELVWDEFRKGSESAFIAIYNKFFQILYNYGRQLSGDKELIKDCIQNTFITIRTSRRKLPAVLSVQAYLLKSFRYNLLRELKKNKKNTSHEDAPLDFDLQASAEHILIEKQIQESQIRKMEESINQLSLRQKEAIYYYYYNNLTYLEIKDIMGFKSIEATRNLLYRAITTLRKFF
ncbi:sigma-70 family RNA polymerase sigma factor [Fulvivirga maritima]|uniref:RNA polymerase sigma factor n=1 Tax=Fulvivirga maritima TaxID=2904247 RepID=UPI001F3542CB|nr:sigma-70 family RNA polymerase sigma factor [Fulvivirga maritima]UII24994.1 sigma-70 family RNA polymerase sigma factor [Fulvivirga maritima]